MNNAKIITSAIFVSVTAMIIGNLKPPEPMASVQKPHSERVQEPENKKTDDEPPSPEIAQKPAETKPEPAPTPVPTPTVAAPPEINCGPHPASEVYDNLIAIGVPKLAAIQQLGSWKSESGGQFDQCQAIGDGGIAHGLNSWHPGRRYDMPLNLKEQINWAIHVEMPRDCRSCYDQFMAAESIWSIRQAIQKSTRWGVEGGRWTHADTFLNQF